MQKCFFFGTENYQVAYFTVRTVQLVLQNDSVSLRVTTWLIRIFVFYDILFCSYRFSELSTWKYKLSSWDYLRKLHLTFHLLFQYCSRSNSLWIDMNIVLYNNFSKLFTVKINNFLCLLCIIYIYIYKYISDCPTISL